MVPSGPPTQIGGAQSVSPQLLRSNSVVLGAQIFPPLVSSRTTQFSNMSMLGSVPNMSSVLNHSFGNGVPNYGLLGPSSSQREGIDTAVSDPLSSIGNGVSFNDNPSSSSFVASNDPASSSLSQHQTPLVSNRSSSTQMLLDQNLSKPVESPNFQHIQQSVQQFQVNRGNLGAFGPVKLEPQVSNDQLPQLRNNLGSVKIEAQQLPPIRNLASVKMESQQHSDQSLFLHQQQQQQLLHMSRQSPQFNNLQQQRLLQMQQQQFLKAMPQQRPQLSSQQFQQQNVALQSPVKPGYEPGMCARRLTHYMYKQQHRPEDNNIDFWRTFVAEYFAPHARKKWCVFMYGNGQQTSNTCGRQPTGVSSQDVWHCEICNCKPGRGFEATVEVLPRLFKIKYESGTLEELLYVDMPREYHNSSGQIVLDYAKAIQESVFEQLRVVRDGQLRIVFSPELKICSWEFCARHHEELIPRRLLIPQVSQLGAAAQKYQTASQNASSNISASELQNNCNTFVASARQLEKALEVPLVNDLGYTKRYVRCLQISEVVNSMKDLIDYSRETRTGPIESLANFTCKTSPASGFQTHTQTQQADEQLQQQTMAQNSNTEQSSVQASPCQIATNNSVNNVNNSINPAFASTSSTISGLLHQNSINLRHQNSVNTSSPYAGNTVPISSPCSSSTIHQAQLNSSFHSQAPSSTNNLRQSSHTTNLPSNISLQKPALSSETDPSESQSSVQKILQEMMMSGQISGVNNMVGVGSLGNNVKSMNGFLPTSNMITRLNGTINNSTGIVNNEYRNMGMINGMRSAMGNYNGITNERHGIASLARDWTMNSNQQQDLENQLLNSLGAGNGYNDLQYDWKPSP